MEETIEVVRRISHERFQQRTVEEIVDVPEADQGQSTCVRQPSVSRAGTNCTGAGVVADREPSAFEGNPAGNKADVKWTATAETPQLQYIDGLVVVPVATQRQNPREFRKL